MPLPSYRVLSDVYIGPLPSHRVIAPKIKAEDIKSGPGNPPTRGSYGHASNTFIETEYGFKSISSGRTFETTKSDGLRNGPIITQWDDYYFGHWIHAGTDNPPSRHSLIPKMPDFGLIESPRLGMYFPDQSDTPVALRTKHDIVNAVDPNRLGYFQSRLERFEGDLRKVEYDKLNILNYESTEWIKFLAEKRISTDTTTRPGIIGLGIMKSDQPYAAAYHSHGYLMAYDKFEKLAKEWVSRYGVGGPEAVEAMKRSIILHEFAHVLGIRRDKKSEKRQGLLQAEFYSNMAEKFKGTKMERIYGALAREGRDYAKEFSTSLLDLISMDGRDDIELRRVEHKFIKEAIELGVDDIEGYVGMRMEETLGPILKGEPSYKSKSKSKSKSNNSKKSNSKKLEEIVDESDEASFDVRDGKITATYKGEAVGYDGASMSTRFIGRNAKESKNEDGDKETYEGRLGKSEYKNMREVKEREQKAEKAEEAQEAEAAASN